MGRMADERQQPEREEPARDAVPTPSDGEIFGTPSARKPAQNDLFASLAEYASEPEDVDVPQFAQPIDRDVATPPSTAVYPPPKAAGRLWGLGCLSRAQKILIAGIIAIAAALLYVQVIRTSSPILADRTEGGKKVRTGEGRRAFSRFSNAEFCAGEPSPSWLLTFSPSSLRSSPGWLPVTLPAGSSPVAGAAARCPWHPATLNIAKTRTPETMPANLPANAIGSP